MIYKPVHAIAPARCLAVLFLAAGGLCLAQSSLPATSPTTLPDTRPLPGTPLEPPLRPAPTLPTGRSAEVIYAERQLQVSADNSSLNQILREIGRQTGMKITGGVNDQRVFGKYGPGAPEEILADLLQGTGSNMLLRETASNAPAELILTPREGGPTPPNPNAHVYDEPVQQNLQAGRGLRPYAPGVSPETQPSAGQPASQLPPPIDARTGQPFTSAPYQNTQPGPGQEPALGTTPQSPNGVQTPQQIYQQLQQLQRSQPQ